MADESFVNGFPLVKREIVNNTATRFFSDFGIDSLEINLADIRQVAYLINKNIKKVSLTLLNNHLNHINILVNYNPEDFGPESLKLFKDSLAIALKSVDELCQSIKLNQQDAVQIFKSLGIAYEHGNLPPSCDGLFLSKVQINQESAGSSGKNKLQNFASRFFLALGIDTAEINFENPLRLTKFITDNKKEISKAYFNNAQKMHSMYAEEVKNGKQKEVQKVFSSEVVRLINDLYNEVKTSVNELCQSIKLNQQDAVQIFESIGITYTHGNLPPSCDGLFLSKVQINQESAGSSEKNIAQNIATKFFLALGIDTVKINLKSPLQITKFIKENREDISKAIFNNAAEVNKMLKLEPHAEILKIFGGESIRLLNDQYNEVKDSVTALCQSIKAYEQDAVQIFEFAGIDHTANLPAECDGLF